MSHDGQKSELLEPAEARIQSIARANALLDAMADGNWVGLKLLAERTGLAKSTAFNLVTALVDVGWAERDAGAGAYRLGTQLLIYGKAVERRLDISEIARPHLVRLCANTRETVNLAIPRAADVLIVESLEGTQSLRVTSYAGTRAPYHSTACGRALLAHKPDSMRRLIFSIGELPALTSRTITDPALLESQLEQCRKRGWATEYEENELGGACVAAPIFNHAAEAVAAVSIAGPSSRFDPETVEALGKLLVASVGEIGADLQRHTASQGAAR